MSGPLPGETAPEFWENPETVRQFAGREPDRRLVTLAGRYPDPARVRVLDLGCAGGRNTRYLAARGFAVTALDSSRAMVEVTRRSLAGLLGDRGAAARVRRGTMTRLDVWETGSVDLLVALGIFQSAQSQDEWRRALAEARRVLARGGLALVANFTPAFRPPAGDLVPVPGSPRVYEGMASGRSVLFAAGELDREFSRHGFRPLIPTETVSRDVEGGRRVTANALYLRT